MVAAIALFVGAIVLFGFGLIYGNWGYIVLAVLAWVLLVCVEGRVEKVSIPYASDSRVKNLAGS